MAFLEDFVGCAAVMRRLTFARNLTMHWRRCMCVVYWVFCGFVVWGFFYIPWILKCTLLSNCDVAIDLTDLGPAFVVGVTCRSSANLPVSKGKMYPEISLVHFTLVRATAWEHVTKNASPPPFFLLTQQLCTLCCFPNKAAISFWCWKEHKPSLVWPGYKWILTGAKPKQQ